MNYQNGKQLSLNNRDIKDHIRPADLPNAPCNPVQLEYFAYHRQRLIVFMEVAKHLTILEDKRYHTANILASTVLGGLDCLKNNDNQFSKQDIQKITYKALTVLVTYCAKIQQPYKELYECIIAYVEFFLSKSEDLPQLLDILRLPKQYGLKNNFLPLKIKEKLLESTLLFKMGDKETANEIIRSLYKKPFLFLHRKDWVEVYTLMQQVSLSVGDLTSYHTVLFKSLRYFHLEDNQRLLHVKQIKYTYRSLSGLLLTPNIDFADKANYLLHLIYFFFKKPHLTWTKIDRLLRYLLLGGLYVNNYLNFGLPFKKIIHSSNQGILITRAMGGIGDFLMMTPAILALRHQNTNEDIVLAIPKAYFSIFKDFPIKLFDIETEILDTTVFRKWINLTDCPAARTESRTLPNVKWNRIDIFAKSMGVTGQAFKNLNRIPSFYTNEQEKTWGTEFLNKHKLLETKLVGVHLASADTYKDYPHINELIAKLAEKAKVLLFHGEKIDGYDSPNVIKIDHYSFRQAAILVQQCNVMIVPDSAFLHLAAVYHIPTIALFGPTGGKIFTKHYPNATVVDVANELPCVPCWRNEHIPCKLTNGRESVCMKMITTSRIIEQVNAALKMKSE